MTVVRRVFVAIGVTSSCFWFEGGIQSTCSVRGGRTSEAGGVWDGGVFWHYNEVIMSEVHPEDVIRLSVRLRLPMQPVGSIVPSGSPSLPAQSLSAGAPLRT